MKHEKIRLKKIDSTYTGAFKNEEEAKEKLAKDIKKLSHLQEILYAEGRRSVLIIFQGMDTSGKDSMIKHVMRGVNPQGCEVHSFKAPSHEELAHGYLWRCQQLVPARGKIGIFNRSYYEEVTIARVHRAILEAQDLPLGSMGKNLWKRRFEEINQFEEYLTQNGTVVLKFFLHISEDEQKKRILERIQDPQKHYKFDVSDIREREYWKKYLQAYEDAFAHTHSKWAPWHIVTADHKWSARVRVAEVIVKTLEGMKLKFPHLTKQGEENLKKARSLLLGKAKM
jgi:PPK2 family polyphosphate:nucleotide phosphotransferase